MIEETTPQEEIIQKEPEILAERENFFLDPRRKRMWNFYVKPNSSTFGNASGSARKAGYSTSYARMITQQDWFIAYKRRYNLLNSAERVLDKTLVMETKDDEGKEQADLLRVQVDAAKFVAKTLGKDEGYSERQELTGKGGEGIVFMPVELMEKYNLDKEKQSEGSEELIDKE